MLSHLPPFSMTSPQLRRSLFAIDLYLWYRPPFRMSNER